MVYRNEHVEVAGALGKKEDMSLSDLRRIDT
jgi:hypothetical protein